MNPTLTSHRARRGKLPIGSGLRAAPNACRKNGLNLKCAMKTGAFLRVKGSSQRIPNKNIMLLDGEPLFLRSLKKLPVRPSVGAVRVDTE